MPLFSVLVPVYRTDHDYLLAMIDSVREQTEPSWELVLVDDGSDDERLTADLRQAAASDDRIVVDVLPRNGGIVAASRRALQLATGEFVALLDHDDLLDPRALQLCREAIEAESHVDVIYSDETIIDEQGAVLGEFTKPDWSPYRLRGQMYTGHLGVYRRRLLEDVGGFRQGSDGSQDYDVVLRATEKARHVVHLATALYRWRTLAHSVSHSADNQWVFDAAIGAVQRHLDRSGVPATVVQTDATGRYRIDRRPGSSGCLAVVVCPQHEPVGSVRSGLLDLVDRIGQELEVPAPLSDGPDVNQLRVLLVSDDQDRRPAPDPTLLADLAERGAGATVVDRTGVNAAINGLALETGAGRLLCVSARVLARDVERWLADLPALADDPGVGIAAPALLDTGGELISAGLTLEPFGGWRRIAAGATQDDPGPFGAYRVAREVSAVDDSCWAVDLNDFLRVGGLSERMSLASAVIDVGCKLAAEGRPIVVDPDRPVRVAAAPPLPALAETPTLLARWRSRLIPDPYWPY